MRDQGGGSGGTLCSPPIEKKKVSLKVTGREESNDNRKRLSGGYPSYLGAKPVGNMSASASRLKGGSTVHNSSSSGSRNNMNQQHHNHHSNDLLDHLSLHKSKCPQESEPPVQPKRKLSSDEAVLPQWGHRKRSRCSRFEQSKHALAADESAAKAVRGEKEQQQPPSVQANGVAKVRGQSTMRVAASIGSKPQGKEGASLRNGPINSGANGYVRANSTECSPAVESGSRQASAANGGRVEREKERDRASPQKADQAGASSRARSGHDAEATTAGKPGNNLSTVATNHHHNNGSGAVMASSSEATHAPSTKQQARVDMDTLEWPRILITLSRKEKEEDFLAIKGSKLPQRPKKRPKAVEKTLHYITPGNWLTDLSRGRYDVREKKCSKKQKPGGLKAMESVESDSE